MTMRFTFLTSLVALATGALAQSSVADAYVASESSIAKAGILANIGPSGSKSQGARVSICCMRACAAFYVVRAADS